MLNEHVLSSMVKLTQNHSNIIAGQTMDIHKLKHFEKNLEQTMGYFVLSNPDIFQKDFFLSFKWFKKN